MNEITLLLVGAGIALASSVVAAVLVHLLDLRKDKITRQRNQEEEIRENLTRGVDKFMHGSFVTRPPYDPNQTLAGPELVPYTEDGSCAICRHEITNNADFCRNCEIEGTVLMVHSHCKEERLSCPNCNIKWGQVAVDKKESRNE